jgi:hypothetical protein
MSTGEAIFAFALALLIVVAVVPLIALFRRRDAVPGKRRRPF